jgi:hypothetical protein
MRDLADGGYIERAEPIRILLALFQFGRQQRFQITDVSVREVNAAGETIWEINKDDLPGIPLHTVQEVSRLANGNTLINNWVGSVPQSEWPTLVQLIEVTPAKKVVWALRDWSTLGPASSTQLLDEPGSPDKRELQR